MKNEIIAIRLNVKKITKHTEIENKTQTHS